MREVVARSGAALAVLVVLSASAAAQSVPASQSPSTPLPIARNGVITPQDGSRIDPHMPVMHPKLPGRTPVIRPPAHASGGRTVIDPR